MDYVITGYGNLYKRGSKGEVRVWRMELGVSEAQAAHRVVSGILDGAETPTGWNVAEGKNTGKKNATTSLTQAQSEVENNYAIKRSRGYFDDVTKIDEVPFTKPMLAQDYDKRRAKIDITKGVVAQPKLDGIRCIARSDGLWTRTGQKITSMPHIIQSLEPMFEQFPDVILDGELYNHNLKDDFNTITSIVRKVTPTEEELSLAANLIEYHVYDTVMDAPYTDRLKELSGLLALTNGDVIHSVPSLYTMTQEGLDVAYGDWMADGYEGQMIRVNAAPYEHKRSNDLLKRKDFVSDEFPVRRMEEGKGNWAGCVKRFVVELPDGTENDATPRGTQGALAALLREGKVPDWATVRYFGRTPDGKLRFPIATDWGWGARKD